MTKLNEGTLIGAGIGATVGLCIGYRRGDTLWLTALVGLMVGGVVSYGSIIYVSQN